MQSGPAPAGQHGLKGETRVQELTRAERSIARRSAETRATVPDLELGTEVDAGAALALTHQYGCSLTAVLVRACAIALNEHPHANAAYRDGHYELYSRVNIAVAVETAQGHFAPTVLDADRKSLQQLSTEIEASIARALAGELTSPELAGATFTLADLGAQGVGRASAFLTPPQAAVIAAGAARAVPVLRDGAVVPGHTIVLTLACDGRILFGARAAGFLKRVADRLGAGLVD